MRRHIPLVAGALAVAFAAAAVSTAVNRPGWQRAEPMAVPRSEVAAAPFGREIAVAGGFEANGSASARVDAYSPARNRWRRLPDLPAPVHHPMAAGAR